MIKNAEKCREQQQSSEKGKNSSSRNLHQCGGRDVNLPKLSSELAIHLQANFLSNSINLNGKGNSIKFTRKRGNLNIIITTKEFLNLDATIFQEYLRKKPRLLSKVQYNLFCVHYLYIYLTK